VFFIAAGMRGRETLFFPPSSWERFFVILVTLGELLKLIVLLMQDAGPGGKPYSLAGSVYSRMALEKTPPCCMCNVVVKLLKLPFIILLLGVAL